MLAYVGRTRKAIDEIVQLSGAQPLPFLDALFVCLVPSSYRVQLSEGEFQIASDTHPVGLTLPPRGHGCVPHDGCQCRSLLSTTAYRARAPARSAACSDRR